MKVSRLFISVLIAVGALLSGVGLGYAYQQTITDTGYGYSESVTSSISTSCFAGWCADSGTWNHYYDWSFQNAYYIQTAARGVNTDGGAHCVDEQIAAPSYNTYESFVADTYGWGSNPKPPGVSVWIMTQSVMKQYSTSAAVWSYSSNDAAHTGDGWYYAYNC